MVVLCGSLLCKIGNSAQSAELNVQPQPTRGKGNEIITTIVNAVFYIWDLAFIDA